MPYSETLGDKRVLVVGGGVAGLQVARSLACLGVRTLLVEREPALGGHARFIYRDVPTEDEVWGWLEKLVKSVVENPLIEVETNSEVLESSRERGRFRVRLKRRPRFVDPEKCNLCGKCERACPIEVPRKFEMGLGRRKAIHLPVGAYPKAYLIDEESCLRFRGEDCRLCEEACPRGAVAYGDEAVERAVMVDAVVVATGFRLFDPSKTPQYGYGRYRNVINNMEFERMLNPSGPTSGKVVKVSDGERARSVIFLTCVGSRDLKHNPHCCRVGCPVAIKQALSVKERYGDEVDVYVCYIDLRAVGRGVEEYYRRAMEEGVIFIQGQPSEVRPGEDGRLTVELFDRSTGKLLSIGGDLVVLETGISPNVDLAQILGLEVAGDGFYRVEHLKFETGRTGVEGVFVAGTAEGPKNIAETLDHASKAALNVFEYLLSLPK